MHILGDGLLAFLAALGLSVLIWLLADALLRRTERAHRAFILLPVRGDAREMEESVMAACAVRRRLGRYTPVLLLDCGLTEAGRSRAALMACRNDGVTVLTSRQLKDYIGEN